MGPTADFAFDDDDRWTIPVESRAEVRRSKRRRTGLPWLRMSLFSAAAVTILVLLAEKPMEDSAPEDRPGAIPPVPLMAPPPLWEPVARPTALYGVEGVDRAQALLEVRRHAEGGREDTLSFGQAGEPGSARLRFTRNVPEPEGQSFYIDLVRQGAEAGLSVVRSAQAAPLVTKFGLAEAASVTFAGESEQTCLAVRFIHPEIQFTLRGWLCGSPVSKEQLTCLIDRLAVTTNEDPALKVLFAQAERQRLPACAPIQRAAVPKPPSRR
jgi:hypothetical protein